MSANGDQIWVCCACENPRQYGDGYPEEIISKQLGCSYCGKVTAHRFSHVDWDAFSEPRKSRKLTPHGFVRKIPGVAL